MIARYTSLGLNERTSALLQHLVHVNVDSRDNYRKAAEHTQDKRLQSVFRDVARQRDDQARALQTILWSNAEPASDSRSVMSSDHGMRLNSRVLFTSTAHALLDELLRIEDHVKQQYINAIEVAEGRAIRQLLQEQLGVLSVAANRIGVLQADDRL